MQIPLFPQGDQLGFFQDNSWFRCHASTKEECLRERDSLPVFRAEQAGLRPGSITEVRGPQTRRRHHDESSPCSRLPAHPDNPPLRIWPRPAIPHRHTTVRTASRKRRGIYACRASSRQLLSPLLRFETAAAAVRRAAECLPPAAHLPGTTSSSPDLPVQQRQH